jgi:hydroxymethylglutaryl-CoA reductase
MTRGPLRRALTRTPSIAWALQVAEGIQRGHMSLHASNIALAAGATPEELPEVVARLIKDKTVRHDHAERVLAELRSAAESPLA